VFSEKHSSEFLFLGWYFASLNMIAFIFKLIGRLNFYYVGPSILAGMLECCTAFSIIAPFA